MSDAAKPDLLAQAYELRQGEGKPTLYLVVVTDRTSGLQVTSDPGYTEAGVALDQAGDRMRFALGMPPR